MGRPAEVNDDEIITAALQLESGLPTGASFSSNALWKACGMRGKPARLWSVWSAYRDTRAPAAGTPTQHPRPLPQVREQLEQLVVRFRSGLEETVTSMAAVLAAEADERTRSERDNLAVAREALQASRREHEETLDAAADELAHLRERARRARAAVGQGNARGADR